MPQPFPMSSQSHKAAPQHGRAPSPSLPKLRCRHRHRQQRISLAPCKVASAAAAASSMPHDPEDPSTTQPVSTPPAANGNATAEARRPLWCFNAPSSRRTLKLIHQELKARGGGDADVATELNRILRRDPEARISRNFTLRMIVADLIARRDADALRRAGGTSASEPHWARGILEDSLYLNDIPRIYADLLKDDATLKNEASLRERVVEEAAWGATGSDSSPSSSAAAPVPSNPISRALSTLRGFILRPTFFGNASLWTMSTLLRYANVLKHDPDLQLEVLRRLNGKGRHMAVIERVQSGHYATSQACEAEYLRAYVESSSYAALQGEGPQTAGLTASTLPALFQEIEGRLKWSGRSEGGSVGGAAASAGVAAPLGASAMAATNTVDNPIHVKIDGAPGKVNPLLSAFRAVISFLSTLFVILCLWVIGAAAEGSLASRVATTAVGEKGTSTSAYAPKEYMRENIPEASIKTFDDVKGCEEAKQELQEVVEYLKNPERFVRLGAKLPKGVLLSGPPGTGKTLLAKAVAGEAGVPFFYRAGSEFEEMFVGVGSRRVRTLFQAAKKKAPCIIFIDEIDAIGSDRKAWENSSRKTLNQMLTEMDGFEENSGVIVMAATNMPEILDPALTRPGRFDRLVTVDSPDVKGRIEILEYYLSSKPVSEDVSAALLARKTSGFSGAQLANMINEAALSAAKAGAERITTSMLDEARDKVMMGRERSITRSDMSIRKTAYHEAGHALVALFTDGADPLHKATINPRGSALGITWQMPPTDEYSRTRTQVTASVDVCMGGTVAEAIVFGEEQVGVGATSDLSQATKIARMMVRDCGFSEEIGPMKVDSNSSYAIQQKADNEVGKILRDAKQRVRSLLIERKPELHAVANALISDETLDAAQMRTICEHARLEFDEAGELVLNEDGSPI